MKKFFKVLSLVLVFMLAIAPIAVSFAEVPSGFSADQTVLTDTNVVSWFNKAAGAIQVIGYGVALVMVLWLGIQYMLAQPAKKAELKGKMWSMLIGIILLVAGSTIIGIIWGAAENLESETTSATGTPKSTGSSLIDTSVIEHLA